MREDVLLVTTISMLSKPLTSSREALIPSAISSVSVGFGPAISSMVTEKAVGDVARLATTIEPVPSMNCLKSPVISGSFVPLPASMSSAFRPI
jgi:hypothetical protein